MKSPNNAPSQVAMPFFSPVRCYSLVNNNMTYYDYENCYPDSIESRWGSYQKKSHTLKVYPNPAMDKITVEYEIPSGETGEFRFFSSSGQLMMKIQLQGEFKSRIFDVSKYLPGIYNYHLKSNSSKPGYGKLVILR